LRSRRIPFRHEYGVFREALIIPRAQDTRTLGLQIGAIEVR